MLFEDWLFHTQKISFDQYRTAKRAQLEATIDSNQLLPNKLIRHSLDERRLFDDISRARPLPFGRVLSRIYPEVIAEEQLVCWVTEWRAWHLEHIEPISDYRTDSSFPDLDGEYGFGQRLFTNQVEKKIVACFLTDFVRSDKRPIINDSDHVALSDGSSTVYVGLAAASRKKHVTLITSNDALIRELRENPIATRSLSHVWTVGGQMSGMPSTGGEPEYGKFGRIAKDNFLQYIKDDPGATTFVCAVEAILPGEGPYAPNVECAGVLKHVLQESLANRPQIRDVVFIADYTKMLKTGVPTHAVPIFSPANWREIVAQYRQCISVVTCPPEAIKQISIKSKTGVKERTVFGHPSNDVSPRILSEYDKVAKDFYELLEYNFESRFFEAVATPDRKSAQSLQQAITVK